MYVRTSRINENTDEQEFIIMDLKGNILKTLYLPQTANPQHFVKMMGMTPRFYSIANNRFYYLVENEEEETWELHVKDIK